MRALLNSLGLTIWSSIAIVLAAGMALVAYRLSVSMKDSPQTAAHVAAGVASVPPAPLLSVTPSLETVTPLMHGQKFSRVIEPQMRAAEAALQAGRWQDVLDDAQAAERKQGITVFDTKTINHFKAYAHLQLHDSSSALADFERVLATGIATPEETAIISKTVSALQARAEPSRDALPLQEVETPPQESDAPQREAEPKGTRAGDLEVKLGEVYYGVGEYQKAIDEITRGLQKGVGAHLDEAYVYLGLAQQKLDNVAEARRAFAHLKGVPNINPRILRMWTLYADTLAGQASAPPPVPN
jgi:tetratricopeptide (TPR) repeat protein